MTSTYKVDSEKAARILKCLTPPHILINSPPFVNGELFATQFKKEGFSVLSIPLGNIEKNKDKISRLWNTEYDNSIIVEGHFPVIDKNIFTGTYSYVYLYPNVPKEYAKKVMEFVKGTSTVDDPDLQKKIDDLRSIISSESSQPLGKKKKSTDSREKMEAKFQAEFKKFVDDLLAKNRETYKKHCEHFDDRVFTVLV
jgi:hypothetical protein